jgi:hypothetical protein
MHKWFIPILARIVLVSPFLPVIFLPYLAKEYVAGSFTYAAMAVIGATLLLKGRLFSPLEPLEILWASITPATLMAGFVPWMVIETWPPSADVCHSLASQISGTLYVLSAYIGALVVVACWVILVGFYWHKKLIFKINTRKVVPIGIKQISIIYLIVAFFLGTHHFLYAGWFCTNQLDVMRRLFIPLSAAWAFGHVLVPYLILAVAQRQQK